MANNYDFLFKFIIIGDSSIPFLDIQVSVNPASSYVLLRVGSNKTMNQL